MHIDDESPRWARFRRRATRALAPLTVALPLALLLASAGLIVGRDGASGWGNFAVLVAAAGALFAALLTLRMLRRARDAREFSRRDSVVLAVLVVCAALWMLGTAGLSAPVGPAAGVIASAFIHGMFGAGVATALLIASAARRRPT